MDSPLKLAYPFMKSPSTQFYVSEKNMEARALPFSEYCLQDCHQNGTLDLLVVWSEHAG
jgi:hypothetical protein